MLKTLQTLGTGATLTLAKTHGASGFADHGGSAVKLRDESIPAHHSDVVSLSGEHGRRALYDFGGLPFCNEVFPGGETRGERYGPRDPFGRATCQGPSLPHCEQPLFNGVAYARQYPGRTCLLPTAAVRIGK